MSVNTPVFRPLYSTLKEQGSAASCRFEKGNIRKGPMVISHPGAKNRGAAGRRFGYMAIKV